MEVLPITMHPFARNLRQDAGTNDIRAQVRHGNTRSTHDTVVKIAAQRQEKHKILHGDETYFASYFSWCGNVARLTKADPKREMSQIFMQKNLEWLRNLKTELGSQRHGRRFRVWRREQAVVQCAGTDWTKLAQDRLAWRAKTDAMIKWRKQKMDRNASPIE